MNLRPIYRILAIATVACLVLLLSSSLASPVPVQADSPSATPCTSGVLPTATPCAPTSLSGVQQGGDFTVTLITPTGTIYTNPASLSWNANALAKGYYIYIATPSGPVSQFVSSSSVCSGAICSWLSPTLPNLGDYTWYVKPFDGTNWGTFSTALSFTLPAGKPSLVTPIGAITNNTPTFTWKAITGADGYYIYVAPPSGSPISQWVPGSNCNSSVCTLKAPSPLIGGSYTWYVMTWGGGNWGLWSDPGSFSLPPGTPIATAISMAGDGIK